MTHLDQSRISTLKSGTKVSSQPFTVHLHIFLSYPMALLHDQWDQMSAKCFTVCTCIIQPAANKAFVHIGSRARAEPSFSNARWCCLVVMYNSPSDVASSQLSGYHLTNTIKSPFRYKTGSQLTVVFLQQTQIELHHCSINTLDLNDTLMVP
jgi:hypothetical protein